MSADVYAAAVTMLHLMFVQFSQGSDASDWQDWLWMFTVNLKTPTKIKAKLLEVFPTLTEELAEVFSYALCTEKGTDNGKTYSRSTSSMFRDDLLSLLECLE